MRRVIERVGPCRLRRYDDGTHFDYVARAIVYQQLSGKAAATIFGRVVTVLEGPPLEPGRLLSAPDESLRGAGLSRQKVTYLRDLATQVVERRLAIDALHTLPDNEVETQLVGVKGIGRWTAQMFLLFRLGRADVLPDGDLGVRKGMQLAYGMRRLPTPARVLAVGARWAPYRSVASWYLWRVLDHAAEWRRTSKHA